MRILVVLALASCDGYGPPGVVLQGLCEGVAGNSWLTVENDTKDREWLARFPIVVADSVPAPDPSCETEATTVEDR